MTSNMARSPAPVTVRLEVRVAGNRPTAYEVGDGGFLVGSVPGCDLRLPGTTLAPVLCLIGRHVGGASLRKLAPVQPITVNGRTVTSTYLNDGDRVVIGQLEMAVSVTGAASPAAAPAMASAPPDDGKLRQQMEAFRAEQVKWAKQKQEMEAELHRQRTRAEEAMRFGGQRSEELEQREQAVATAQEELARRKGEIETRTAELARQEEELTGVRRELGRLRHQLSDRYQQKRDKVLAQQQAIRKAARKVQERKRGIDTEETTLRAEQEKWRMAAAEVEARAEQVGRERGLVEEQYALLTSRQQEHQRELSQRLTEIDERDKKTVEERVALEKSQKQHQADLVRLDRIQAAMETRQKQLGQRALEIDKRFEQLQRETRDLEDQAGQMDEWHARLTGESARLAEQKKEQEGATSQFEQRAAALESQQTMLATLRTRMERMREELRQQELGVSDQRAMLAASEEDVKARLAEAEALRIEAANDRDLFEKERRRFDERRATMEQAVAQLRAARESVAAEQAEVEARREELEESASRHQAQAEMVLARGTQVEDLQQRLASERQAIREREAALTRAEQVLQSLQEQVRRRSEDLAERQRKLEAGEAAMARRNGELDAMRVASDERSTQARSELDELRRELTAHGEELERRAAELSEGERRLAEFRRRLEEEAQTLGSQKQAHGAERLSWDVERQAAREQERTAREEVAGLRERMQTLLRQLPELEMRASATLDRLGRAREQLREHLAEIHGYARHSRDDLEAARGHVQAEAERVRQQELDLRVARDEHRVAVAGFRQQLGEWQGKVGEMRHALQLSGAQMDRRQADLDALTQEAEERRARLATEAAELEQARQEVAVKRGQMDRHLGDMREWYRKKIRELAGVDLAPGDEPGVGDVVPMPSPGATAEGDERSPARAVLSMADEVAPADKQLGELLASMGLVDSDTQNVLWAEARRQRRSLRQLLLAGNYLTLYQMALIEAGNLDGLVLGPVRVIDKLPSTPRETVYRVFDPRRETECVLRHLAESEMQDAVRPDEFRQRFGAAIGVKHGHVAAVLEVLEIGGRPAALLEYVAGLPSGDWPGLAAAPGAWYRLVCQGTLALNAAHEGGLTHGHLDASSFVLTREGSLKVGGFGEPPWLAQGEPECDETPRGDLMAFGRIAAAWAATPPGGKSKAKPLPAELQTIMTKMEGGTYADLGELVADLELAGHKVPASTAAWERLLRHVSDQAAPPALRRTA